MQAYSYILACNRGTAFGLCITFQTLNFTFAFQSDSGSNASSQSVSIVTLFSSTSSIKEPINRYFSSLRTAKRTAPEHPVLGAGTLCSVHFQLPPRGASLGTISTGPVDSPNMPFFCPPVPASLPLRVPSCFKDLCILYFRLK
jgi:hypothetical protein